MMKGVEFQTERLVVRTVRPGDGVRYAAYYRQNREFLQPYSPTFEPSIFSAQDWELSVPVMQRALSQGTAARFCILQDHEMVGVANLTQITRSPTYSCILGYTLGENFQGRGIMREALGEVIRFGFERMSLHRICANYMPRNERSGRLLRRLGFQVEGYARDYLMINGRWEDHILSALINPDIPAPPGPSSP